jgi:hypothetical protein
LWALIDKNITYITQNITSNDWLMFNCDEKPRLYVDKSGYSEWVQNPVGICYIKINYTGDWRDSLTKRPEGY